MTRRAGVAVALALVASAIGTASALAASPTPSPVLGGDPRSSGQGPGLVGDPLAAIIGVVVIGGLALLATLLWLRLTAGREASRR